MTPILLQAILAALASGASAAPVSEPSPPSVLKVDPPSWWPGHTVNPVRLLVRGKNLMGARVISSRRDVSPGSIRVNERGTYLFVSLELDPKALPGDASLRVETRSGATLIPFRLEPSLQSGNFKGAQGIGLDDVIYLIMTDRFCDGDPANNVPPGSPPGAVGRDKSRGFHGGDLRGIIDHLPYFQELGVTALWLTPWYDNFNGIYECDKPWCPYTYYHGYHAVDHYAVEDHFGTLEVLRELVAKAHTRGLKVIQDQVSNHVGLRHPWVDDPPLATWFHGTSANHVQNPFRSELLLSPHAPASARASVLDGWFSDDSPDLNQDEPEVARYLIQHALWWLDSTGIDGIREDTAQYLPRWFLRDLCDALHRQSSKATIIGEILDLDPMHTSFFLGGRTGWDGVDTRLDSVFDAPTWWVTGNVFSGKLPMTALRDALKADALYSDPQRLTTMTSNHDLRRFISWPQATRAAARLQMAFTLTLRGTPQLYYGDEIALPGEGDPDNRRDFPGGFPGDARNAFLASGRTAEQEQMWTWTRDWIALRKAHPALRWGALIELDVGPNLYVFARRHGEETIVIALNRDAKPATARFPAAALGAREGMQLVPLLGNGEKAAFIGAEASLRLPPNSAIAFRVL
jgi:neopullulanase